MTSFVDTFLLRLVILGCLSLFASSTFSQAPDWVQLMQDPNSDFADTRAAFDAYWANRKVTKGAGWKPFKRWEHYMETRLTPTGKQSGPLRTAEQFQTYLREHPRATGDQRSVATATWRQMGPVSLPENGTTQPNGIGRVNCVAFDPVDPNTLYIGSPSGGFWKSSDYGLTWNNLSTGLTRLGVSSIVIDPTNPSLIYIGTGDRDGGNAPGYGVWYSTNGGQTWQPRKNGMGNRTVSEILMHPTNSSILIAATTGSGTNNGRIYRSVNGGANWTQVYTGSEIFKDLAFKPGDPNVIYAGSNDFYRSVDNGQSWAQVTNGVPSGGTRIALAVSADQPAVVYLLVGDNTGFNGLYRSSNNGVSFSTQSTSPNLCGYAINGGSGNQAWYDLVAVADPADADHLYTGAINVWESFDAGQTWSIVTHWEGVGANPAIHADDHSLDYSLHTGDLFLGHDGGIHYSANAGGTWADISDGLAIAQVYHIAGSATESAFVMNGYQDNGMAIYRDGKWRTEIGGDVLECAIDYSDSEVLYGAVYHGDIRRSTNGGINFTTIGATGKNGITESGAFETPFQLDPINPDQMYAGYSNVWRSSNCKSASTSSVTWTKISTFSVNSTKIRRLKIAPSDPDVIYISRDGTNRFYRTNNASAANPTWTNLTANLPSAFSSYFPQAIEVHPTNPSILRIALGYDIYESTNGGNSWTNISGTLPNIILNTIVYDKNSPVGAMYVGMDAGVYYRNNTMTDWELFDVGLPNVEITELEMYYDPGCRGNDMLRAGTYGRGLWETDLRDPGTIAPNVCFMAIEESGCEGSIFKLEDQSAYVPTAWNWTFSPATVSFVNGTHANSQHPQVVFVNSGSYTVSLTAGNANGSGAQTRTAYLMVNGTPQGIPAAENFDGGGLCGTDGDCAATVCTLPGGWENPTNGVADDVDWRVHTGATVSNSTGPSGDATSGTGNYLYMEASGSCTFQMASLVSPCINLGNTPNPELSFAYHMYGANMGELHLDVFYNGQWIEDVIPAKSGDMGNQWLTEIVNLSPFNNSVINLRFRGVTGAGYLSDMAIDDVFIGSVFPVELMEFSADLESDQTVQLTWATASEQGNDYFIVEHSSDGIDFDALEKIEGAGTTQDITTYEAVDDRPYVGANYYRLQQVDMNGTFTYSNIVEIVVPWRKNQQAQLSHPYPDPFADQFRLDIKVEVQMEARISVFNSMGQLIRAEKKEKLVPGWQTLTFDSQELPAGVYYIRVEGYDFVMTRKAILQR